MTYVEFEHRLLVWVRQFIEIFEALVVIFSLTLFNPNYSMRFFSWQIKRGVKLRQKNQTIVSNETCSTVSNHS